ncbi:MAG TPA: GNAT family N-acetyltransferase [Terracidiphilus sp.]|nr:GNAT family N-acetyltransferase [Terracidiphilus sp.]
MHQVRRARPEDLDRIADLRVSLWPEGSFAEHRAEAEQMLATGMNGTLPAATFVAENEDGGLDGFVEVGLRSHADECNPARPVGFIEGWFVREEYRQKGIGGELMNAAEEWCRKQRCLEMASDARIDNTVSHHAHEALGFEIVDRCVHFRKTL